MSEGTPIGVAVRRARRTATQGFGVLDGVTVSRERVEELESRVAESVRPVLRNPPWPEPPVPFGKKTLAARTAVPAGIASSGLPAARRAPRPRGSPNAHGRKGLVIKFPPVDLRARADVPLPPVVLYGRPSTDGAAVLRWTATCTNLDGRQEDVARMPVEQLGVTLPPDAEHPELAANQPVSFFELASDQVTACEAQRARPPGC